MKDFEPRVKRVLDQLSCFQKFISVRGLISARRISEPDKGPSFSAFFSGIEGFPGGYGKTPAEALQYLEDAVRKLRDDHWEGRRSEHSFRSALRHVQTEMVNVEMAFGAIRRATNTTLDDERGTPRGFFENMPPREAPAVEDGEEE